MPPSKILVIEDDASTAEAVTEKLRASGFTGIARHTGAEGLAAWRKESPDLVVLDLALPDMDGLDICRVMRQEKQTPIIMLTAKVEETDRIVGLEIGADDYVTKPFSPKELVSRIRAVLRRAQDQSVSAPEETVFQAAGIELDEGRHEVRVDGELVKLTPIEYKLLSLLIQSAGQVVDRDTLTDTVWGYDGYSSNLLEIHIGKLRRKVEKNPRRPTRIITVRSFGYRLVEEAR